MQAAFKPQPDHQAPGTQTRTLPGLSLTMKVESGNSPRPSGWELCGSADTKSAR